MDVCGRACIFLSACVYWGVHELGQDQQSKSTLERVAQSSSPTHLPSSPPLCLSHLADVPLHPVHRELKSSGDWGAKERYRGQREMGVNLKHSTSVSFFSCQSISVRNEGMCQPLAGKEKKTAHAHSLTPPRHNSAKYLWLQVELLQYNKCIL